MLNKKVYHLQCSFSSKGQSFRFLLSLFQPLVSRTSVSRKNIVFFMPFRQNLESKKNIFPTWRNAYLPLQFLSSLQLPSIKSGKYFKLATILSNKLGSPTLILKFMSSSISRVARTIVRVDEYLQFQDYR